MSASTDNMPTAATVIIGSVWDTLGSADWAQALGDDHQRTWLLTLAVCDALYLAGVERVPNAKTLQDALDKLIRNQQIVQAFDGTNYRALATEYRLSTRTVRRIVERGRERQK